MPGILASPRVSEQLYRSRHRAGTSHARVPSHAPQPGRHDAGRPDDDEATHRAPPVLPPALLVAALALSGGHAAGETLRQSLALLARRPRRFLLAGGVRPFLQRALHTCAQRRHVVSTPPEANVLSFLLGMSPMLSGAAAWVLAIPATRWDRASVLQVLDHPVPRRGSATIRSVSTVLSGRTSSIRR